MKNAKDVKQKLILIPIYSEIKAMKQVSSTLQISDLRPKTIKVIYNAINGVYTLLGKNQETLAQFNCETNICVIKGCGYFMHFTEEQLQSLLKGKSDKIVIVGGRRAVRDTERNIRKNDSFSPFIIR